MTERMRLQATLQDGKYVLPDQRFLVPRHEGACLVSKLHYNLHFGGKAIETLARRYFYLPHLFQLTGEAAAKCTICAQHNAKSTCLPLSGDTKEI